MKLEKLTCEEDVVRAVDKFGFLPFFACGIPGFSVEEATPPEFWFVKDVDGPWEWKEHLSSSGLCAYGKFFSGRAGYVSRELLPHFINYRRDGYDFDARFDDELASFREKELIDAVQQLGAPLSHELREYCGYIKDGKKGFETLITRLQMKTYLTLSCLNLKRTAGPRPTVRHSRVPRLLNLCSAATSAAANTEPSLKNRLNIFSPRLKARCRKYRKII